MPATPRKTVPSPNAIYIPQLIVGSTIDAAKQLKGRIDLLTIRQASVTLNAEGEQEWTDASVQGSLDEQLQFGFDSAGNVTGLPADLASIGPSLAAAWAAIVKVTDEVNAIRELA